MKKNDFGGRPFRPRVLRFAPISKLMGGKEASGLAINSDLLARNINAIEPGYQALSGGYQRKGVFPHRFIHYQQQGVDIYGWNSAWLAFSALRNASALPLILYVARSLSHDLALPFPRLLARCLFCYSLVESLDPDIVHATGPLRGLIIGRLFGSKRKLIISYHGILSFQEELCTSFDKKRMEKESLHLPAWSLFMGTGGLKQARDIRPDLPLDRALVIPSGIQFNEKCVRQSKVAAKKELGIAPKSFLIVTAATLSPLKGQHRGIKALQQLPSSIQKCVVYYIAGDGAPEYTEKIKKTVMECGLQEKVRMPGRLPHNETLRLLRAADLVLMPSSSEGYGMPVLEGLASGTPCVASRKLDAINEIVPSQEYGVLVENESSQELARGIKEAFLKKWDEKALLARARQLSWEKIAERYIGFYEQVAQNAGG